MTLKSLSSSCFDVKSFISIGASNSPFQPCWRGDRKLTVDERGREKERGGEGFAGRGEKERRAKKTRARARRRYDIARCKLQFCCEIIIKYIMPSRLLPHNPLLLPWSTLCFAPLIPPTVDGGPARNRETRRGREEERRGEEGRHGVSLKVSSDAYS